MVQIDSFKANTDYVSIDLNTTGTTTLYNPDGDAAIYGVYMENGGSTAEVNLETTDGTDTGVLAQPGAGGSLEFGDTLVVDIDESVQVNVTTAEGSALSTTAVIYYGE